MFIRRKSRELKKRGITLGLGAPKYDNIIRTSIGMKRKHQDRLDFLEGAITSLIFFRRSRVHDLEYPLHFLSWPAFVPYGENQSLEEITEEEPYSFYIASDDYRTPTLPDHGEMFDIPDILYMIFGGFAAGVTFGIGKLAGSILSEAGKDFYKKIKQCVKNVSDEENKIIEVCIEIEHGRYICFLFPDIDKLDEDFDKAYQVIMDNKKIISLLRNRLVDLESPDSTLMKNKETIAMFRKKTSKTKRKKTKQRHKDG